ncbi:MAG: NADH:flavin oxidoreductase [Methanoregulaceae archaeon]|jgi:2,4-dienoyl-CoA reductase-like NADH-dependent reductase (Old Yellow Enzyme family)|nr:NADH:flavin oxidoreductase [Methanoregulaceae archaeon]
MTYYSMRSSGTMMPGDPFGTVWLKNIELRNCFVFAAAASGGAADPAGVITSDEIGRLVTYVKCGLGLIITGAVGISAYALSHAGSSLLVNDRHIAGFSKLTRAVHEQDGKIAVELCHSGIWTGGYMRELGREAIAPSYIPENPYITRPGFIANYHAASEQEIEAVISSFGEAAARAKEAGFDAVEVHGAHDSLLAQFLSPLTNHRNDRWGGTLENRARIHCETGLSIRSRVGDDYPVILKIGVADGIPGGLGSEDGRKAAGLCRKSGFDILEISQGLQGTKFSEMALRSPINSPDQEGFSRGWCRDIKKDGATTIMTGGLRSWGIIEETLHNGETDYIGLCRPLIREPGLIRRWQNGDRSKSTCISCNKCGFAISKGLPLACYVDKPNYLNMV